MLKFQIFVFLSAGQQLTLVIIYWGGGVTSAKITGPCSSIRDLGVDPEHPEFVLHVQYGKNISLAI